MSIILTFKLTAINFFKEKLLIAELFKTHMHFFICNIMYYKCYLEYESKKVTFDLNFRCINALCTFSLLTFRGHFSVWAADSFLLLCDGARRSGEFGQVSEKRRAVH